MSKTVTGSCPRCRGKVTTESYSIPAVCCGIVFWLIDPASDAGQGKKEEPYLRHVCSIGGVVCNYPFSARQKCFESDRMRARAKVMGAITKRPCD